MSVLEELKDVIAKNLPQLQATELQEYIKTAEERAVDLERAYARIKTLTENVETLQVRIKTQEDLARLQATADQSIEAAKKLNAETLELRVSNRADVAEAKAATLLDIMHTIFRNATVNQSVLSTAVVPVPATPPGTTYSGNAGVAAFVHREPTSGFTTTTQT